MIPSHSLLVAGLLVVALAVLLSVGQGEASTTPKLSCFVCGNCSDPFDSAKHKEEHHLRVCPDGTEHCYKGHLPDKTINRGCSTKEEKCLKDPLQSGVSWCYTCETNECNSAPSLRVSAFFLAGLALTSMLGRLTKM